MITTAQADSTVFTSDIPDISDVNLGEDVDYSQIMRGKFGVEAAPVSAFNSSI
jgi:hypothetical protein